MRVEAIFLSPHSAEKSEAYRVNEVDALAGLGLEGDRYAEQTGHWQQVHGVDSRIRDVSFITLSGLTEAAMRLGWAEKPLELARLSRRNILLSDGDLSTLVGTTFQLGGSVMLGTGDCDPCTRPNLFAKGRLSRFSGKNGLQTQDGLRARVTESGLIKVGDEIEVVMHDKDEPVEGEVVDDEKDKK